MMSCVSCYPEISLVVSGVSCFNELCFLTLKCLVIVAGAYILIKYAMMIGVFFSP